MAHWYTVDEVAQMLRVSRDAVYDAVNRGDLAGARVGKVVRVHSSHLAKFLNVDISDLPEVPTT